MMGDANLCSPLSTLFSAGAPSIRLSASPSADRSEGGYSNSEVSSGPSVPRVELSGASIPPFSCLSATLSTSVVPQG